jgi:hypothetical protein
MRLDLDPSSSALPSSTPPPGPCLAIGRILACFGGGRGRAVRSNASRPFLSLLLLTTYSTSTSHSFSIPPYHLLLLPRPLLNPLFSLALLLYIFCFNPSLLPPLLPNVWSWLDSHKRRPAAKAATQVPYPLRQLLHTPVTLHKRCCSSSSPPHSMPAAPSSGKSSRRTSRNFTQITLSAEQERELQLNSQQHRRDHTKSSSHNHPRRESSVQASNSSTPSSTTQPQRPPLKARAQSAPLVPKVQAQVPPHNRAPENGTEAPATEPGDEEIADDPFFQRYSFPQTEGAEEESQTSSPREAEAESSPISPQHNQLRPRPDSAAEPVASPMSPRSPRSV